MKQYDYNDLINSLNVSHELYNVIIRIMIKPLQKFEEDHVYQNQVVEKENYEKGMDARDHLHKEVNHCNKLTSQLKHTQKIRSNKCQMKSRY